MPSPGSADTLPAVEGCPPATTLASYAAGSLEGDERVNVGIHLETCATCREALRRAQSVIATDLALWTKDTLNPKATPAATNPRGVEATIFAKRYELRRLIGSGGMGAVYEALDQRLNRLVALKVLRFSPNDPDARAEAQERLRREAQTMAVLSHKNVVAVYDVGTLEDEMFVAMQLIDGTTLRAWLAAERRSVHAILRVLVEAGNGLAAAHAARLYHRDFKPDNVLISARGTARVTDFGLARRADFAADPTMTTNDRVSGPKMVDQHSVDSVTRSGSIVGTPAYMAPEQATGGQVDARADQFSFSVTAWEALFGARPFGGTTWSEIYANVIGQQIAFPPTHAIPRNVMRALRKGLSVEPEDRHASMTVLLDVLQHALHQPLRRKQIAVAALAASTVVGAMLWLAYKNNGGDDEDVKVTAATKKSTVTVTPIQPEARPGSNAVSNGSAAPPVAETGAGSSAAETEPAPKKEPKVTRPKPPKDVKVAVDPVPGPPEPDLLKIDPRIAEAKTGRSQLDTESRKRGLLATDLPDAYRTATRALDDAITDLDADKATAALGDARKAIAGVVIDRKFIDQKLQRINAQVSKLPDPERFRPKLSEVLTLVGANDHDGANRKLNEIVGMLRSR